MSNSQWLVVWTSCQARNTHSDPSYLIERVRIYGGSYSCVPNAALSKRIPGRYFWVYNAPTSHSELESIIFSKQSCRDLMKPLSLAYSGRTCFHEFIVLLRIYIRMWIIHYKCVCRNHVIDRIAISLNWPGKYFNWST